MTIWRDWKRPLDSRFKDAVFPASQRLFQSLHDGAMRTLEDRGCSLEDAQTKDAPPWASDLWTIIDLTEHYLLPLFDNLPDKNFYYRAPWTDAFEIGYELGAAAQRLDLHAWERRRSKGIQPKTSASRRRKSKEARDRTMELHTAGKTAADIERTLQREGYRHRWKGRFVPYSQKQIRNWTK